MKKITVILFAMFITGWALTACAVQPAPNTQTAASTTAPSDRPQPTATGALTVTPEPSSAATVTNMPTAMYPGEEISFTTDDEIMLSGTLFGDGRMAVILAHQGTPGADQTTWQPFAQTLAEHGFTTLTFDFRGVGQSDGALEISKLIYDMEAAIDLLQDLGYDKIACVGASMGGTACLRAALDHQLVGLVVFASHSSFVGSPTAVQYDELARLNTLKLFLTASNDRFSMVVSDTAKMYELSPEPKELHIFEGMAEHGTELFDTDRSDELTNALLEFLTGL